ncbi:SDR family oxidoreductase [Patulibacter sp.]|uniref:SDR family NAD(P)-dependent oxidoreductase n=1 Tax=Patulibacter sp. TaxID=1912859 RepID=UPI002717CA90|nr:SDR family NAD(P)-dependent oxidoreductase [Patulibacter sp.]MDO9406940.1 SDR family NAD(P)-dependent oxidoreductase [Patulibacter sp.]
MFGAGPGLGSAVARRFGREGFEVALVARRPAPLAALADELSADGITARAFPADLSSRGGASDVVERIRKEMGRIDTVYYGPVGSEVGFTPARSLTSAELRANVELLTLAPVDIVQAVLPEMTERRSGAILFGFGTTAAQPKADRSGAGPAMAATRNYAHGLAAELSAHGIHVGSLLISALIEGSAAHTALAGGDDAAPIPYPVVEPDTLAEALWTMAAEGSPVETQLPS